MLPYNQRLKRRSQELRGRATPQENKLWYEYLRKHPCSFARQKPIDQYIVDFYCKSKKLVIEIDGYHHFTSCGLEYDSQRTAKLKGLGLHELRFTNDEIIYSFEAVCAAIQEELDKIP